MQCLSKSGGHSHQTQFQCVSTTLRSVRVKLPSNTAQAWRSRLGCMVLADPQIIRNKHQIRLVRQQRAVSIGTAAGVILVRHTTHVYALGQPIGTCPFCCQASSGSCAVISWLLTECAAHLTLGCLKPALDLCFCQMHLTCCRLQLTYLVALLQLFMPRHLLLEAGISGTVTPQSAHHMHAAAIA